jgi:hypothetical protein
LTNRLVLALACRENGEELVSRRLSVAFALLREENIGEHIVELFGVGSKRQMEHDLAGGAGERVL